MKTVDLNFGENYKLNGITFVLIDEDNEIDYLEYTLENGTKGEITVNMNDKLEDVFPFNAQVNKIETMQQRINRFKNNYNGGRVV